MHSGIVTLGVFRCLLALVVPVLALTGCNGGDTPMSTPNHSAEVVSPAGDPEPKSQLVIESIQSDATQGTDCTLPGPSAPVEVFNVPRKDRVRVYIQFYGDGFGADATFSVQSENPDIVKTRSPKDDSSGEVILTVEKGSNLSSAFIIEGIEIDKTRLDIAGVVDVRDPNNPNDDVTYPRHVIPVVVWDFEAEQIVDYNAMGNDSKICYDKQKSPALKPDMASRTSCGVTAKAVAADGASLQLLRVKAGGPGKVCFTFPVVPSATRAAYYGKFSNPIAGGSSTNFSATNVSSIAYQAANDTGLRHYAFGTYTPPSDFFETSQTEREVEVEVQFIALNADGSPTRSHITAVKGKKIKIRRPPVILVHGLWSNSDTWANSYKKPSPSGARLVESGFSYNGNLPYTQLLARNVPNERLDTKIRSLVVKAREGTEDVPKTATTKVDVIAHSMGGLYTRQWIKSTSYKKPENFNQGNVHKLATLTTPHWGARLANALINLHQNFHDITAGHDEKLKYLEDSIEEMNGNVHYGAICELAENNPALVSASIPNIRVQTYVASGGNVGSWHYGINLFLDKFSDADKATHSDPYLYKEANDGIVSEASQADGLPTGANFTERLHTVLGFGSLLLPSVYTVTGSTEVAQKIYLDLDTPTNWANSMPAFAVDDASIGVPIRGGRGLDADGASFDKNNYLAQCASGSPMYVPEP